MIKAQQINTTKPQEGNIMRDYTRFMKWAVVFFIGGAGEKSGVLQRAHRGLLRPVPPENAANGAHAPG